MAIMRQKTLSATAVATLDQLVNDFIGKHTVDNRSLERIPTFVSYYYIAPNFYVSIIYDENPLSS